MFAEEGHTHTWRFLTYDIVSPSYRISVLATTAGRHHGNTLRFWLVERRVGTQQYMNFSS